MGQEGKASLLADKIQMARVRQASSGGFSR